MGINLFSGDSAGTTTTTTLASQGGLLINIDSATGDIARTTNGFIEDEKYGCWLQVAANATSAEFDTAIIPGEKVLKLSATNITGNALVHFGYNGNLAASISVADMYKYSFPLKASTKYILKYPVKTVTVGVNGVYTYTTVYNSSGTRTQLLASTKLSGTNDWTWITHAFTTGASDAFCSIAFRNEIAGTVSDAYLRMNSMTLEEVVEPVANSLTSSSPSLVSFTAVGSTDNIDQSQATQNDARGVGGDGSTAVITNKIAQQFTPAKSKFAGIVIRKIADIGTFTGTVTAKLMNDNAGAIGATTLASLTLSNATYQAIANDTDYTINLPSNLTADGITKYWVTLEASTSDALNYARIRVQSGNPYTGGIFQSYYSGAWNTVAFDLYFKTLYYKPTTNFKASQNNSTVSISADEDGFLNGSVVNLTTGAFNVPDVILTRWNGATTNNSYQGLDVNKYNAFYSATNVRWTAGTTYNIISPTTATPANGYVTKFQGLGFNEITTSIYVANVGGTNVAGLAYSYDGVNYTEFATINDDTQGGTTLNFTIDVTGNSTIYISLYRKSGSDLRVYEYKFAGTVDVSSLSTLRNYPTNKDIIKQYSTTLGGATTSATYRATKWGFPAIEYSATEYQFLDIDTTATGSTVAFSELGTSYTTVADGASLAITSTSTPSIWVKHNITANRLYLSSNDYNASSDKDGSLKQSVVYQVKPNGNIGIGDSSSNIKLSYG